MASSGSARLAALGASINGDNVMPQVTQSARTQCAARNTPWAYLVTIAVGLSGCATVPTFNPATVEVEDGQHAQIIGSHGPLSRRQAAAVLHQLELKSPTPDALARHLAIEQAVTGESLYAGNRTRILRDGKQTFPAIFAAIRGAQRSLWLEYYTFEDIECDGVRLSDLLLAKHSTGVRIAVLYDGVGSSKTPKELFERLRTAGIAVLAFNPPNPLAAHGHWSINDRDHRKILLADQRLAIVGGINMSSSYESAALGGSSGSVPDTPDAHRYWRDTDLQIEGPAASELSRLFVSHWNSQGGSDLALSEDSPSTPADGSEFVRIIGSAPDTLAPHYYATLLSALRTAERRIWVTAAYFVPTHQEKSELIRAARRGVDVRILVPSDSDSRAALAVQRSTYADLLGAGVKIFERQGVILHTKCVTVDGVWAVIGSSNFDHRSVLFNDEVDAVVLGTSVAGDLEQFFVDDTKAAQPIVLSAWAHRPPAERVRELFWRLSTSLL
jgi:cardiolipin synthase